jgi:hypothetical protein
MADERAIQGGFSGDPYNCKPWTGNLSTSWRNEMLVVVILGAVFASLMLEGALIALDQIDA